MAKMIVARNSLEGWVPETGWQAIAEARNLDFSHNHLQGSLPRGGVCAMRHLMQLGIKDNQLEGRVHG
eukprot:1837461-Amphidinium_carterae.1